jgi:hypothetical protein
MTPVREDFNEIDQMVGCHLGEDWMLDFGSSNEAAEAWIVLCDDEDLTALVREIDALFALTHSESQRRGLFSTQYAFASDDDRFDVWLRAVRVRAVQALAGIHSEPMEPPAAPGSQSGADGGPAGSA